MQCTKSRRQAFCEYATGPVPRTNGSSVPDEKRRTKKARVLPHPNTDERFGAETPGNQWFGIPSRGKSDGEGDNPKTSPGSILVKGDRSRYLGLGDRILMLDHVSKLHVEERAC